MSGDDLPTHLGQVEMRVVLWQSLKKIQYRYAVPVAVPGSAVPRRQWSPWTTAKIVEYNPADPTMTDL